MDGEEYTINSDFRDCLRIILAFEDNELTSYEKQVILLENLYSTIPENVGEAIRLATMFLNGGKEGEESEETPMRVYSFAKDSNFIFSAFKQTHGVDLDTADMHWWKFLALFMDLGSETTFCNLIGLRKRVKTGKATKEERQAAREMGDLFELEDIDTRTLDERAREDEFMNALNRGKNVKV